MYSPSFEKAEQPIKSHLDKDATTLLWGDKNFSNCMKTLIYLTALSLVAATSIPAVYANSITNIETFPYIRRTTQFPQGCKWGNLRHTFELQIPQNSGALSQLNIDVPEGLKVKNDISIFNQSGGKIPANTSVKDNKIRIVFSEAISPGNILTIDLNKVNRIGTSNAWLYAVSAKLVGVDTEIRIGMAQFRLTY